MNFALFESLSDEDAQAFLASYCTTGAKHLAELAGVPASGDAGLNYSPAAVREAFEEAARTVATVPQALDESLPYWIRDSESYRSGLYDFTEEASIVVLHLSYYLAETLMRTAAGTLRWGVGDRGTAVQGQPVLEGFKNKVQMSPLLVTENLLRRLIEEPDPAVGADVERAITTWQGLVDRVAR